MIPRFMISLFIYLNAENKLIAKVTIDGEAVNSAVAAFENIYFTEYPDVPTTGDKSNITFWLIMFVISGTACIVLALIEKKYARLNH